MGKVNLATELDIARHGSRGELKREGANGSQIGRNVVTESVAPCYALDEIPFLVPQAHP